MAEASKNYGKGIAKDLEEKAETLADIESLMDKLYRKHEEHTVKTSEIARDSMAVRATLQQLRTERQTEARVYHASRQKIIGRHAKSEIRQAEWEQSHTSSEQAAEAFTRAYDGLQRTMIYSVVQAHHLNIQVIQEKTACLADIEELRRFGQTAEQAAYESQDKSAEVARLFRQQYNA